MAPFRKRRTYKRVGSKKLSKGQKTQVKKLVNRNIETKMVLPGLTATPVTATGAVIDITGIAHGTTASHRLGEKVTPTKLVIRYHIKAPVSVLGVAGDWTNMFRFIVFRWRLDSNKTAPTAPTDILETASSMPNVFWLPNYFHRKNYEILYDRLHELVPTWAFDSSGNVGVGDDPSKIAMVTRTKTIYLKKSINYTTGGTSGINKLYVMCISDSAALPHPVVSFTSQLYYKDA